MNLDILLVTLFGGMLVLYSYWFIFIHRNRIDGGESVPYNRNPAWLGLSPKIVNLFIAFQLLAVIGFITGIAMWTFNDDSLQHRTLWGLDVIVLLTLFFLSAMLWAPCLYYKHRYAVVFSLVVTALASMGLLGLAIRNSSSNPVGIVSWTFLCIVTVLIDAVIWNHYYIIQHKQEEEEEAEE